MNTMHTTGGILARAAAIALSLGVLAIHASPLLALVIFVAGLHIGNVLDISGE
jgi:hypothetical protein